jgi:hypothetical protein
MLNIDGSPAASANEPVGRNRWTAQLVVSLLGMLAVLAAFFLVVYLRAPAKAAAPPAPPGPNRAAMARRQGFGPGRMPERKLVKKFDQNGDGRLNAAERKTARDWVAEQGSGGGPRRGPRAGRFAPASAGPRVSPADVRSYPDAPLYDPATLRTFFLEFENADWETELEAFYGSDVDVPATVMVDGRTYRDVGVHFRGNSSFRMVPRGSKRPLNLAFDFANPTQDVGGYRTLNFLNANGDPTFARTVLYSDIARHYIPTAKTNFVKVVINGESWGLYVNAEQVNKDFLREGFGSSAGARWKVPGSPGARGGLDYLGEDVETYKRVYEIKTKDDPKAWADLVRLTRTLNQAPIERLESALKPILDIDGVLKFLAVEIVLHNSDGYWIRASDYAIYQDPAGVFHVIPHDFNEGFNAIEGRGYRGDEAELDPLVGISDAAKPLRSRLLAVPALRKRYLALVRDIANKWLDWKTLGPMAARYRTLIAPEVEADTGKLYTFEQFLEGFGDDQNPAPATTLKGFADRRRAFLIKQ